MPLQYAVKGGFSAFESGLAVTSRGLALGVTGMETTIQGYEASKRSIDMFVEDPLLLTEWPRATEVALTTAPVVTGLARDQRRETSSEQRERRGEQLRDAFTDLGPAFVKLGQTLSVRPDLVPEEYIDALEDLQDRVPPAPWRRVERVIEAELGPIDEAFDEFEREPLAGASLGQVYRAELDGETVAVKVRRPDIEKRVQRDLRLVESAVPVASAFLDDGRAFTLETIVDQFADTLREELDYEREAAIMERVRENFADDERVKIPAVVDSHTTERVLTMEYVDGTKVSEHEALDSMAIDRAGLANTLRELYLQMTLVDGVFHADPHPGNVAVQPDGTIVLYDFGMAGVLDPELRSGIVDFFVAINRGDVDAILESLIGLGTLDPAAAETGDDALGEVVERFVHRLHAGEFDAQEFESLVDELEEAFYELPFRLPPDLVLVLRVMAITDGVANTLDPEHDFFAVIDDVLADHGFLDEDATESTMEA
ncbi:ABC1 kinase family protein [Haloglomus halophilum]|uniref:ABC1 kinase family protein n=1 Tax=Haloglomus halophilum TaxID=2962672 RepID=UPI0020C9BA5B|nr:AarF/ABC1/UbiB kinase family protein [Haloglomus halophilum]